LNADAVRKQLKQGIAAPLYVLYGSQKYMIEEWLQEISKAVLDTDSADFNLERFDMNEVPVEKAIESAETLPFLGAKRLVMIQDAHFFSGVRSGSKVEHQLPILEQYLSSPAEHAVVVFICYQDKLDERKKLVKLLKDKATLLPCSPLKEDQLLRWLTELGNQLEVTIEADAQQLIIQFVGNHLQLLSMEMKKLAQYVGKGGTITQDTVLELIAKTVEQDVFTLVDHVVNFRFEQAFSVLRELLVRNEEPIKILFLLARQFRLILRAKELERKGYTPNQMVQHLGVHPFVAKLVVKQGKRYSQEQLVRILERLAEADFEMKTGRKDKALILELFLLSLPAA
jgi:DNA polymerase-3 subunit delta